jgi:hypothetical protein
MPMTFVTVADGRRSVNSRMMNRRAPLLFLGLITAILLGGLSAGCAPSISGEHALMMAPLHQMPADVQAAPATVREAYQFAAANPEIMKQIPCYCGCGAMGHTSNYSCYVTGLNANKELVYDAHALGCSICVDITQDVMRLLRENQPVPEIRAYIDQTYGRYGPSNMQ